MNRQYACETAQAKEEHADFLERGSDAIGESWEDVRLRLMTPEQLADSAKFAAKVGRKIEARDRRRAAIRHIVTGIVMLMPKSKRVNIPHRS